MATSNLKDLIVEDLGEGIQLICLNRPESRNAIRNNLLDEIAQVLSNASKNEAIRCVIIYGGDKIFAAGADIKELSELDTVGVLNNKRYSYWKIIKEFPKPLIAAVNGYALGGGCELAMHADIIIAGNNAQFGQPEINLGIIPGAGGTQRLIRCVGKSLAMKMVLSGEFIDARQALTAGLVAEITEPELTLEKAKILARKIAQKSPLAVQQAKELMLLSFDCSLQAGLTAEHKAFTLLSATDDRDEGIKAFLEKRPAHFTGK